MILEELTMQSIFVSLILMSFLVIGCVPATVTPLKTQLEIREFQTRSYDTSDTKMVMKSLLNVLQDDGFIVKTANMDIGLLAASKEVDVEDKGQAFVLTLLAGRDARWGKNSSIECSGNVTEMGKQTRVRMNFQMKTMDNKGGVKDVKTIEDAKYYQEFFAKVDKGIFIGKQKL
jgi:hypothetical protein